MSQTGAGKTKLNFDSADVANSDSVAANLIAGGTQLTATGTSLDVNVTASALPTGAATETTLASILTELQGTIDVSDSVAQGSLASILSEIQGLSHAEDAAHVSGDMGVMGLAVRNDASSSLVSADGDYAPLQVNALGELKVAASITIGDNKAEDSAHVSGDMGSFSLAVRNDNQSTTATSASGDYSQFSVDDKGALFVKDISNKSNLQQIVTVGTSAVALPASPLANRSNMMVQMLSGGQLYLGSATVTNTGATRGMLLQQYGFWSGDVGPDNVVYGIANAAGKDVMVWEFA